MAKPKDARLINFTTDTSYIVQEAADVWLTSFTAALLTIIQEWYQSGALHEPTKIERPKPPKGGDLS